MPMSLDVHDNVTRHHLAHPLMHNMVTKSNTQMPDYRRCMYRRCREAKSVKAECLWEQMLCLSHFRYTLLSERKAVSHAMCL